MSYIPSYGDAFLVTPHDTNPLIKAAHALRATVAGNITLRTRKGTSDVVIPVLAGEILRLEVTHVRATGTTATGLVAFVN